MIKIPESKSYCEAYLTLRCNYKCPYCINDHTGVQRKRGELKANEWIAALNNIDFGKLPLTIGGGEPTIHSGFYEIMSGLRPETRVDLLTNGTFDVDRFMKEIKPSRFTQKQEAYYKSIRMSYHVKTSDPKELTEKAKVLHKNGYSVGVFSINHPENLNANVIMTEVCREAGVYFFIRDFLGYYGDRLYGWYMYPEGLNGNKKHCQCKSSEVLIGPSGELYKCHRDLYEGALPIGDIGRITFDINDGFLPCDSFGLCNPCDLKRKASPDLSGNRCSVIVETER